MLPGIYRWVAFYNGDRRNKSAVTVCNDPSETSSVTKSSPTITSQATLSVSAGATISDTATLSGYNAPPGPIQFSGIRFNLFGPDNATCSGAPIFNSIKSVNGNGDYVADRFTPLRPGTYRWVASYTGDIYNNAFTTACNDPGETSAVK